MTEKLKLATVWLDGCSGCHMSLLDMDERLLDVAARADIVYSPLVDHKNFPEMVDIAVVEGSVSTNEDMAKIQKVRAHAKILVALGDCAVTGNVPAMRNPFGVQATMERGYLETTATTPRIPDERLPILLERVRPIHEVVHVDVYVPGCPPPADAIYYVLMELTEGRTPDPTTMTRFGK